MRTSIFHRTIAHSPDAAATRLVAKVGGVLGFALLTYVGAKIRIPLGGTPVPMTLQTLAVVFSGVALGPRLGVASQAVYLLMGLVGVPVFAGEDAGLAYFSGATVGYLAGFLVAPYLVGRLTARSAGVAAMSKATLLGTLIIFVMGVGWLAILNDSLWIALQLGFFPFPLWFGAILKWGLATALGYSLWPTCRSVW